MNMGSAALEKSHRADTLQNQGWELLIRQMVTKQGLILAKVLALDFANSLNTGYTVCWPMY